VCHDCSPSGEVDAVRLAWIVGHIYEEDAQASPRLALRFLARRSEA